MKKEEKIRTALFLFLVLVLLPAGLALYSSSGLFGVGADDQTAGEQSAYDRLGSELPAPGTPPSSVAPPKGSTSASVSEPISSPCSFEGASSSSRRADPAVILSEIAWMGTAQSASDEWIELMNRSGAPVDIGGWQLLDKGGQIKVVISHGARLTGDKPYYLLERTNDDSVPGVDADEIYVGALSNSGEAVRLFDEQCDLVDEAVARTSWPAGDASQKRAMERDPADLSWRTYSGAADGASGMLGTPRSSFSIQ
jgi:hypothetical protein